MFQTHHCELFCEGLCGDGHVRAPRQMLVGGGAFWHLRVLCAPAAASFCFAVSCCQLVILASANFGFYNFQRWMSRFDQR